jgi:lysophospholipase L1-like esterase
VRNRYALLVNAALAFVLGCSSDSMDRGPEQSTAIDANMPAGGGAPVASAGTGGSAGAAPAPTPNPEMVTPVGGLENAGGQGGVVSAPSVDAGGVVETGEQRLVGTWTASPYVDTNPGNAPPAPLSNSVVRQIARVSLGGSQLRVQFSNLFGNGPVTINSAHIARNTSTPAVDSTIDTATDTALLFSGAGSVTIPQGQEVWSDLVDFELPSLGAISVTTAFGNVPSNLVSHSGSRTTSYLQTGSSDVSAPSMTNALTTDHWYYISGIDVMADASAVGVVAIGDSITDGRGTDTNRNNRWTDILAERLIANPATANVAMMNQGIGATNLVGTTGTAAQARFDRDVLGQSGVKYAIIFDGVNDIGGNAQFEPMKAAYDDMISRAHAQGVLVYGATILPFGSSGFYSPAHENVRQQVNAYIKSGVFDGYIDFEAAVTDGATPPNLQMVYAAWAQQDGLHPGPAGYQRMGETPDLTLFTR